MDDKHIADIWVKKRVLKLKEEFDQMLIFHHLPEPNS